MCNLVSSWSEIVKQRTLRCLQPEKMVTVDIRYQKESTFPQGGRREKKVLFLVFIPLWKLFLPTDQALSLPIARPLPPQNTEPRPETDGKAAILPNRPKCSVGIGHQGAGPLQSPLKGSSPLQCQLWTELESSYHLAVWLIKALCEVWTLEN